MTEELFNDIYHNQKWGKAGDGSGPGSTLENTRNCSFFLNYLAPQFGWKSILDVGCGAGSWQSRAFNWADSYTGIDASEIAISKAKHNFKSNFHGSTHFITAQFTHSLVSNQSFDLTLCRDAIMHLDIWKAALLCSHIFSTNSKTIILWSYPQTKSNPTSNQTNQYATHYNLQIKPFNFQPDFIIAECNPHTSNKHMLIFQR